MSILEQLAKELGQANLNPSFKAPSGTPVGPSIHGPNSLFGVAGLERDVISSRMSSSGLASVLPVVGSVTEYPLYPYITGRTEPTGSQTAAECGDGPTAGNMKTVLQTAQFGSYKFKTRELNVTRVGSVVNAGEVLDQRYVNDPLAEEMAAFVPMVDRANALDYGREVLARFVDVGIEFQDLLSQQIYTGTGTTNEFPGLELLVVENHYDAKTGTLNASLASDVRDFGDVDITTAAGATAIVAELVSMFRYAKHTADGMRLSPVKWVFVMREQLFDELTDIWPCTYMASRCIENNNNFRNVVNGDEQIRLRMEMKQGSYLLIDAMPVEVVTDNSIAETKVGGTGSATFSSDVWLLPMTIRGGRQVLFWEFFDYSRGAVQAIRDGRATDHFWTDRGRYIWHKQNPVNGCMIWQAECRPRIRLEVPQVAGRLQNVAMTITKHWRDHIPGQSYYLDGGVEGYTPDTLYNEWSNTP